MTTAEAPQEAVADSDMFDGMTDEEYILWYLQQKGGTVTYVRYSENKPDLNCVTDIARQFGRPLGDTGRLQDAVDYLQYGDQIEVHVELVHEETQGSHEKVYPRKDRVIVRQR
jgi:hypothetical protein